MAEPRLPDSTRGLYLVGGAVRDRLLGLPESDRDWLVVGPTAEEMARCGFQPVGRDFTVFLHPDSHEEYALPRGKAPGASLLSQVEHDLERRDLTLNALALDQDDRLIDPCGGKADLEQRRLRHTPHFADDPLRALRLARFQARYAKLGFGIAPETLELVRRLAASGALNEVPAERICKELTSGLAKEDPVEFLRALRSTGLMAAVLPEVERLFGVPQPEQHHPEIDTGEHLLLAMQRLVELEPEKSDSSALRFALLFHDLGKGLTPKEEWPHHRQHESLGLDPLNDVARRIGLPAATRRLSVLCCQLHLKAHQALGMRPGSLLKLLEQLDALRRPEGLESFLLVCQADAQGRKGLENRPYPQADYLRALLDGLLEIDAGKIAAGCSKPSEIPLRIREERLRVISRLRGDWKEGMDAVGEASGRS